MNGKIKNVDKDTVTGEEFSLQLHTEWGKGKPVVSPARFLDPGAPAEFSELHPNQDPGKASHVKDMDKYDGDGRIYAKIVKDGSTSNAVADFRGWVLIKRGNVVKCEIVEPTRHIDPEDL